METFLVAALKDPLSGNLDRIQIIKGWLDSKGQRQEKVYDVAWGDADKRQPDIEKTIRFTDRLNFLFNTDYPVLKQSRGLGLAMLGAIPVLEEQIVKQNLGESGSNASLLSGHMINP